MAVVNYIIAYTIGLLLFGIFDWLHPPSGLMGLVYRVLVGYWFRFLYLKTTSPDHREKLKKLAMGGSIGVRWAKVYQSSPINERFMRFILSNMNKETQVTIIQIGSSSGREIARLASEFPDYTCVGTDVYEEVVAYSKAYHKLPNLHFECMGAKDISKLFELYNGNKVVVISLGALQYVQPEHLVIFLEAFRQYSDIDLLIVEPSDTIGLGNYGSKWHGNFSFAHDYGQYARQAGLEVVEDYISKGSNFLVANSRR